MDWTSCIDHALIPVLYLWTWHRCNACHHAHPECRSEDWFTAGEYTSFWISPLPFRYFIVLKPDLCFIIPLTYSGLLLRHGWACNLIQSLKYAPFCSTLVKSCSSDVAARAEPYHAADIIHPAFFRPWEAESVQRDGVRNSAFLLSDVNQLYDSPELCSTLTAPHEFTLVPSYSCEFSPPWINWSCVESMINWNHIISTESLSDHAHPLVWQSRTCKSSCTTEDDDPSVGRVPLYLVLIVILKIALSRSLVLIDDRWQNPSVHVLRTIVTEN